MTLTTPNALKLTAAGTLLAVASAFTMVAQAAPGGPDHGPHGGPRGEMMWRGGPGGPGGLPIERLLRGTDATDAQKTQIRDIARAAGDELRSNRDEERALHEQLMQALTQPTVDAAAVESLRGQLQAKREVASKRMTQALVDAANVLTPDQRAKIAQRMDERRAMAERHRAEREALDGKQR